MLDYKVWYTAIALRNGADHLTNGTWRLFGELVGEHSDRFLQANITVPNTQAHQVFLGPTALGIFHNYTVSFGAQLPIYQDVGSAFPKEQCALLRGEFQVPAFSTWTFTLRRPK